MLEQVTHIVQVIEYLGKEPLRLLSRGCISFHAVQHDVVETGLCFMSALIDQVGELGADVLL
jgi:hypothetical protein